MLISSSIFIVSFLVAYLTLSFRVLDMRRGSVYEFSETRIFDNLFSLIDLTSFYLVMGLKHGIRHTYIFLLVVLHNAVSLVKYLVIKVERRFIKLIDSVRGKGVIHKKGSVSLFLREIKQHKDSLQSNS